MLQLRRIESEFLINVQDDLKKERADEDDEEEYIRNIFKFTITIN